MNKVQCYGSVVSRFFILHIVFQGLLNRINIWFTHSKLLNISIIIVCIVHCLRFYLRVNMKYNCWEAPDCFVKVTPNDTPMDSCPPYTIEFTSDCEMLDWSFELSGHAPSPVRSSRSASPRCFQTHRVDSMLFSFQRMHHVELWSSSEIQSELYTRFEFRGKVCRGSNYFHDFFFLHFGGMIVGIETYLKSTKEKFQTGFN